MSDRWGRLSDILDGALAQPEAARDKWLRAECGSDQALYFEISQLLASESAGFTGISGSVSNARTDFLSTNVVEEGSRLGPYKIVRLLGQGGMGAVYEGIRQDNFEKRVAIKLIRFGLDTEFTRKRFEQERQILARLDHPNIARLLDGGDSAQGLPYLVMDFVEGKDLVQATADFTIRQKLTLFQEILSAVAYAHRNLVVHRDLKPSNILVTETGEPKLLDFGISKLIEEDTDATRTLTSATMMTPDYASPEQVRGETVGIASDVYSLGAILYELLTGARPHQLTSYSTADVFLAICEKETIPPSSSVSTTDPERKRQIEGDLDTIILKALQKDPAARYISADAFRTEIERYLDGRPLTIRPASAFERGWKFVKRHRLAVSAAVALAASLIGGITVSMMQARRAERRFAQVRELANTFLFQFYDQVTPLSGSTAVRASIVETARKYLDNLASEAGSDKALLLELAQAYQRLGIVQAAPGRASLGQTDGARRNFERAMELYGRVPVKPESPAAWRQKMALGLLSWCEVEYIANRADAAEPLANRALALMREDDTDVQSRLIRTIAQRHLAEVRLLQGRIPESLALFDKTLQEQTALAAAEPVRKDIALELPVTTDRLARTLVRSGDLDRAIAGFLEMVKQTEPCNMTEPDRMKCRNLAIRLSWTADVYGALDRPNLNEPEKAAALYEQSIKIFERLTPQDKQDRQTLFDLAGRYGKLGDVVWKSDPKRALDLYERALKTAEALVSKETISAIRAAYLKSISRPLLALNRNAEARRALVEVMKMEQADAQKGSYAENIGEIETQLVWAQLLKKEGKPVEAERMLQTGIESAEKLKVSHKSDLTAIYFLSQCYRELAGMTVGEERRKALRASAAAWHAWPATSFTTREEQRDKAAAEQ